MVIEQRSPASPIARLIELWRWRGPVRCAGLVARWLMRPFVDWYIFHILESTIDPATLEEPDPNGPIVVRIHSFESGVDHVAAELAPILSLQPVDVATRLRAGDSVAIAYHGQAAVGCSWFTTRNLPLMWGLDYSLRPDEAVYFGSFVLPEWRGKRIHLQIERAMNACLCRRGIVRTCGSMSVLNPQTLSLAKHTHKRKRMTVFLAHIKGLNWHVHFSRGERLEPRFCKHSTGAVAAHSHELLAKPERIIHLSD